MKKYLLKRILFSVFSLLVVIIAVMMMIYSAIDPYVIFQTDDVWSKRKENERRYYELVQFQKFGYIEFDNYTAFLQKKYQAVYGEEYSNSSDFISDRAVIQYPDRIYDNESVQEFIEYENSKGFTVEYFEPVKYSNGRTKPGGTGYLVATHKRSVFLRLWDTISHLITVETVNDVKDPNLSERYIRIEKDPYSNFIALVGSGTQHKYLVYFDGRFPFMHWNWIHINLGTSYTKYRGQEITEVITQPTGDLDTKAVQFPALIGTDEWDESAIDFHNLSYNSGELTEEEKRLFPDKYTVAPYRRKGLSMLGNSFVIGLIATILAYITGLPLGIMNAKYKDKLTDKVGMAYIVFIRAVPSLGYIFIFAAIGTALFKLPYTFANAEVKILAYILPTVSLMLPAMANLMMWMRRYVIDQTNADYVKFARAQGMSEGEIFKQHIAKNAIIPIVHGIPSNILGCLVGAIITERVYSVPGVGNLLTTAINGHDNGVIVACAIFYTSLSLISVISGDILMAKVDPRISFLEKGGR